MIAMLLLAVAAIGLVSKYGQADAPAATSWQTDVMQTNQQLQASLLQEHNPETIKWMENQLKINEYALEHNIVPADLSIFSFADEGVELVLLISLCVIVVAGGIVANEFSWGTVKFLLVKPFSRSKILLAKYLCVLQFALTMLLVLLASTILCKGILFGFTPPELPQLLTLPHLSVDAQGSVQESSMIVYLLAKYGLASIELFFVATIAFMLSTVSRNAALAIGISLVLQLVGPSVTSMLASKYSWIKYSLFANTSLSVYMDGGSPLIQGMTLNFSLLVLLAYFVALMTAAWVTFTKRDVAS